ncbi:uncharacterized protein LOC141776679 [Sebastes fasciatus]|uniref:uncharacterized protein LOC141776679 n=1 Tax=Sebastes fasciatus TaxID=394691 RepID=UPI003D9DF71D
MKLFPIHPILWSSLLVWCASQSDISPLPAETEANNHDVCTAEKDPGNTHPLNPPEQENHVEEEKVNEDVFRCLLYPTNLLNCSWSFHTLQKDTHLFVNISICDDKRAVHPLDLSSEERVGSLSLTLHEHEHETLYVILRFNISLHDEWTVYTSAYDMDILEVLSPPQNISASVKDGGLLVTWGLPPRQEDIPPECFEYQLDMGDQEGPKTFPDQLSYTEANADPTRSYSVRMRARKTDSCGIPEWSAWSHAVTVEHPIYKLNILVIISISLGIPMILLAVLLLARHQRVTKVLFPPIPRPPAKYKCFLEKNDTFNLFYPAPSAEPVEEITEVEDTEQKAGKTL